MSVNAPGRQAPFTLTQDPPPDPVHPSISEVVGSAFGQFNTIRSLWNRVNDAGSDDFRPRGEDEERYDPFVGIEESPILSAHPELLIGVTSPEGRKRAELRGMRQLQDRENIAQGGLLGFLASMAAGILDPVILFPLTGAAAKVRALSLAGRLAKGDRSRGLLTGGLLTARAGFMGETAAQTIFLATQETRTLGEAATDVTAATVLSAMLGGTIGAVSRPARKLATDRIQSEVGGGAGPLDEVSTRDLEPRINEDGSVTSEAEIKVKRALFGSEKLAGRLGPLTSPFLRIITQSASPTMKRVMAMLGDSSARLKEGSNLGRSVESDVLAYDGVMAQLVSADDRLFVAYRMRLAGKPGDAVMPRVARNLVRLQDRISGRDRGVLSHQEFLEEVSVAATRGDRSPIPEVQEAAELWRTKLFDPIAELLIEQGRLAETILETGPLGARSYLTRIYRVQRLIAREDEFKETILQPWLTAKIEDDLRELRRLMKAGDELDEAGLARIGELQKVADRVEDGGIEALVRLESDSIFENITGLNPGRVIVDPVPGSTTSALKPRVLDIGDELLHKGNWLEKDIELIGERYLRTVVPDVMIQRRFGSLDLEAQKRAIADEYKAARAAATSEKARQKLGRQQRKELKLLDDLVALLRNTYTGGPVDRAAGKPLRVARAVNFLAFGGGFMINSIPDIAMPILRNGLWRTFRTGVVPLVTHFKAFRLAADEVRLTGAGAEFALDSRSRFMYELGDEYATSKIQRGARAAANNFGILNLLAPWNTVFKRFSGVVLQTRIIEALDNLRLGKAVSERDLNDLDFLRLNADARKRISDMIAQHGIETDGPLKWVNTTAWGDQEAREAFRAAIRFGVDQTIITPGLLDRPPMMSTEFGRTIGQFLSFAMSATNRVMLTGLQNPRDLATLNGAAISLSLGMGVEWIKRQQSDRKMPEDAQEWVKAGVDRSGLIGIYGDIYNKLSPIIGTDQLSSRYAARNMLSSALGPTVGLGESAIRFGMAARQGDFTEAEVKNARRLLPYNQIFYVRSLFDAAEEGLNDYFNIPKRRRRR